MQGSAGSFEPGNYTRYMTFLELSYKGVAYNIQSPSCHQNRVASPKLVMFHTVNTVISTCTQARFHTDDNA